MREFNIALKVNSIFREAEEFRGEFTKTRAQAEVAGSRPLAIPLTSWHMLSRDRSISIEIESFLYCHSDAPSVVLVRRLRGWNVNR